MPRDQVEMLWRCGDKGCNRENKGRDHVCSACGRPKATSDNDYLPGDISHEAAVTDTEQLRAAEGGADWKCAFCDSSQRRIDGSCAQCGAGQDIANKPRRSTPSSFTRSNSDPPAVESWRPIKSSYGKHAVALVALSVGIVALVFWLIFRTHNYDVKVSAVEWDTTIHVDRYAKHGYEGFFPDNNAVDLQNLGPRLHHYDHVLSGHHRESYQDRVSCGQDCSRTPRTCRTTPRNCSSNKNGYATCTGGDQVCSGGDQVCTTRYCNVTKYRTVDDYTDVPQFLPFYSWNLWEWHPIRDAVLVGHDMDPRWGDPQIGANLGLGEQERESGRQQLFHITFANDSDTWNYDASSLDDYRRFPLGSKHLIKTGAAHGVEILK